MKTVTLKFVIDDGGNSELDRGIKDVLEEPLSEYPLLFWQSRNSTKNEEKWRKNHDSESGRSCLRRST